MQGACIGHGIALKFGQTVYAGGGVYYLRYQVEQLHYGMLDLAYQLQERCHDTERDGTVTQLQASPYECQQVTQAECAAQYDAYHYGKAGAAHYVALKFLLS